MRLCNETGLENQHQMDLHIYHVIKLSMLSLSCTTNILLSVPLLLVISHHPSLLSTFRFLLLIHLLFCDNLQLLVMFAKTAMFTFIGTIPVTHCLGFWFVSYSLSVVVLLVSAALSVDRCLAVKYPLRYETLISLMLRRATVAVIWILALILGLMELCLALRIVQVNAALPRCSYQVLEPCLSSQLTLNVFCLLTNMLVIFLCYLIMLVCFAFLCWDTRGLVSRYRRAAITLILQMVQSFIYLVFVVLESQILPFTVHNEIFGLTANIIYNVAVSLIPLVYGYRSRQLRYRLKKIRQCNRVNVNR